MPIDEKERTRRANEAQRILEERFWNESISMYDIETPCPSGECNTIFHYWWMAHAADVLIDGYERTGDDFYKMRLGKLYEGVLARNGGVWPNELYDDMEWMALAWLRAYQSTGEPRYRAAALELWADIQTGWNETMGGGIAWHKRQPGYKNTPANAPAVILAVRLHRAFGRADDLDWARRIYAWLKAHLVDPDTGFVWDGMNRLGDGQIDKDWEFTYCQGVFVGAAAELHRCTGEEGYALDAARTLKAARARLADEDGVLPDEGGGDAGLFKGILVRYAAEAGRLLGPSAASGREAVGEFGSGASPFVKRAEGVGERRFASPQSGSALIPEADNADRRSSAPKSSDSANESAAGSAAEGTDSAEEAWEPSAGGALKGWAAQWLAHNADVLWARGRSEGAALFGPDWRREPESPVQLCTQLSGVMLLESVARDAWSGGDRPGAWAEADLGEAESDAESSAANRRGGEAGSNGDSRVQPGIWNDRAERFQTVLYERYHNPATGILNQWFPGSHKTENEPFYYWWQAHVLDVFVDALERTGEAKYAERIEKLAVHLRRSNGDTYLHNYYDDMEWLALALLRAYHATGVETYKQHVLELWADIRTAWNDNCGGGMAWKKDQLDYKNTPANAPAAILAARLYRNFGDAEDLEWAKRIYAWNRDNLVDSQTGFVWDGLNRLGDGQIDKDWAFTYCQGVFLGAGVELYRCTGDSVYLEEARRTASACIERLCDPVSLKLPDEGIDDTGLFKGILVRYLLLLLEEAPDDRQVIEVLNRNADLLWRKGIDPYTGLCSPDWAATPMLPVQLSVQLSGVMLTEAAAWLERRTVASASNV